MKKKALNWDKFDWSAFQTLCAEVAEQEVPDCNFYDHLTPGMKQHGLDLKAYNRKTGKFFCIECKRKTEQPTPTDLEKIIKEFTKGDYVHTSSHFVIAYSNNPSPAKRKLVEKAIDQHTDNFYKKHGIIFDCWFKDRLEKKLSKRWDLVARYFNQHEADEFCNPLARFNLPADIKLPEHYMHRSVKEFKADESDFRNSYFFTAKSIELIDIVSDSRSKSKRIVLIADSHFGKTTLLLHLAKQLHSNRTNLQPLLIDIKKYNPQPIDELLQSQYGSWKNSPLKNLLVIIDGIDEASSDKFTEWVNYIHQFSKAYQPVTLVCSFRNYFYHQYEIANKLQDFAVYELAPLQDEKINLYIYGKLAELADAFFLMTSRLGIQSLLFHPFFLTNIIEDFLSQSYSSISSKGDVIRSMLERSVDKSLSRSIKAGEPLKTESLRFIHAMQKLAFAMQLAGKNAFTNSEMQAYFTKEERDFFQHNSLIRYNSEIYSFENALFQEYIAAMALQQMQFEEICKFASIGSSIRKIKLKWVQTLNCLLSILEPTEPLFDQLLSLYENDTIELILQTDGVRFTDEFKTGIFERYLNHCLQQTGCTNFIYYDKVARFIYGIPECVDMLLNILETGGADSGIKRMCCGVLRSLEMTDELKERYVDFVLPELKFVTDILYAGYLVEVLAEQGIGNSGLVQKLTAIEHLREAHDYRSYVYLLIVKLGLVQQFYSYGLEGFRVLIDHNKNYHHGGSEYTLENFLLSTDSGKLLSHLLDRLCELKWITYLEQKSGYRENFMNNFFEKLAQTHEDYPYMVFSIARFLKELGKKLLRKDFKPVDIYLKKTSKQWLLVHILINDIFSGNDDEVPLLLNESEFDYAFFEIEEQQMPVTRVFPLVNAFYYNGDPDIAKRFHELAANYFGIPVEDEAQKLRLQQNSERDEKKRKKDLEHLTSKSVFTRDLKIFFKESGQRLKDGKDWEISLSNNLQRIYTSAPSNILYSFLLFCRRHQSIFLTECLHWLGPNFDYFAAEQAFNYNYKTAESDEILIPLLERYYRNNISSADFKNCYFQVGERTDVRIKERLLGDIFERYKFNTPEAALLNLVWLDTGRASSFDSSRSNDKKSISLNVLSQLGNLGKKRFGDRILENIAGGIQFSNILSTHVGLCAYLKIKSATGVLLKCIKDEDTPEEARVDAIDVYIKLEGDLQRLANFYKSIKDYKSYLFYHLTRKLHQKFPLVIIPQISAALHSKEVDIERKLNLASLLTAAGEIEGFRFILQHISTPASMLFSASHPESIAKLDTGQALEELSPYVQEIYDTKQKPGYRGESLHAIILQWLYSLANKSEKDLQLLLNFIENTSKDFVNRPDTERLSFIYRNRMLENFRDSEAGILSITEIKGFLKQFGV